jgi:hypothetical protein
MRIRSAARCSKVSGRRRREEGLSLAGQRRAIGNIGQQTLLRHVPMAATPEARSWSRHSEGQHSVRPYRMRCADPVKTQEHEVSAKWEVFVKTGAASQRPPEGVSALLPSSDFAVRTVPTPREDSRVPTWFGGGSRTNSSLRTPQ